MIDLKSKRTLAAAVAALAVAGGGGAALAASSGSSPSPSAFWDSVAKHLGISTERLQDATKAAALEQVDAALDAGKITSEQADALRARIEAGALPPFGLFGRFHPPHAVEVDKLSATAGYLGLSEAELRERLAAGQSLADVARAQGKSVDGLKQAILDGAKERLDEAVAAGKLTEDQARTMLERLEARLDDFVNGTFPGPKGGLVLGSGVSGSLPGVPFMALPA